MVHLETYQTLSKFLWNQDEALKIWEKFLEQSMEEIPAISNRQKHDYDYTNDR